MEFTTPKGTVLPVLDMRGKPYLQVAQRIVWFREERPTWSIETTAIKEGTTDATFRAVIRDETGRVIATSHKSESKQGFPDFLEKAETGSIGRALALCGFGTQFCGDELDEGARLADSPTHFQRQSRPTPQPQRENPIAAKPGPIEPKPSAQPSGDLGSYVPVFGKYSKTKSSLRSIPPDDLENYRNYLLDMSEREGKAMSPGAKEFCEKASAYLSSIKPPVAVSGSSLDFDAPNYDDDAQL